MVSNGSLQLASAFDGKISTTAASTGRPTARPLRSRTAAVKPRIHLMHPLRTGTEIRGTGRLPLCGLNGDTNGAARDPVKAEEAEVDAMAQRIESDGPGCPHKYAEGGGCVRLEGQGQARGRWRLAR